MAWRQAFEALLEVGPRPSSLTGPTWTVPTWAATSRPAAGDLQYPSHAEKTEQDHGGRPVLSPWRDAVQTMAPDVPDGAPAGGSLGARRTISMRSTPARTARSAHADNNLVGVRRHELGDGAATCLP
jgi:hypothetical protein